MGLNFGGGSSASTTDQNSSSTKTFSPGQTDLQNELGTSLSSDLAAASSGGLSPGVQAEETSAADQVNKTSSGLTDRVAKFLASRGFGKSGATGQATLQGELGRESSLAGLPAQFSGVQQNANSGNLLAALNYALTAMGTTGSMAGSSTGSGFNWGAGASGVAAGSAGGTPFALGA